MHLTTSTSRSLISSFSVCWKDKTAPQINDSYTINNNITTTLHYIY
jgi:hypothetical protein